MNEQKIEIGDVVRHRYLAKRHKLYVANVTDTKVLVIYVIDKVFHSQGLFLHEVELFVEEEQEDAIFVG